MRTSLPAIRRVSLLIGLAAVLGACAEEPRAMQSPLVLNVPVGTTASSDAGGAVAAATMDAGARSATPSTPKNAERIVAGLRPKFRSCYNQGLRIDPTMEGHATVRAHIAPTGEVASTEMVDHEGLSEAVSTCIATALRNAVFEPPGGTGSTLNVPVRFVISRDAGGPPTP